MTGSLILAFILELWLCRLVYLWSYLFFGWIPYFSSPRTSVRMRISSKIHVQWRRLRFRMRISSRKRQKSWVSNSSKIWVSSSSKIFKTQMRSFFAKQQRTHLALREHALVRSLTKKRSATHWLMSMHGVMIQLRGKPTEPGTSNLITKKEILPS